MNRIALGTAQFGFSYGVSNKNGQTSIAEIIRILELAHSTGLDTLDTAIAYGNSENNLGAVGVNGWKVVTKLPGFPYGSASLKPWVKEMVAGSMNRMRLSRIYGLLLHSPDDLRGPRGSELLRILKELKLHGLIQKIGLSVYGPDELHFLPDSFIPDIVQMPFNILDRRLIQGSILHDLKRNGVEVHVRSIFLQGLLLMDSDSRPSYFNRWNCTWKLWDDWISRTGSNPLAACLNFALAQKEIDRVVVGIESVDQLRQVLVAVQDDAPCLPEELQCDDPDLIYPMRWKIK